MNENPYHAPTSFGDQNNVVGKKLKTFMSPEDMADSHMEFYSHIGLFSKNILSSYKTQMVVAGLFAVFTYFRTSSFLSAAITFCCIIIFGLAMAFALLPVTKRNNKTVMAKRFVDDAGDVEYLFNDNFISMNRIYMRCEFDYGIFQKIIVGKNYIHLMISQSRVLSFKKSELSDEVVDFLRSKI